MSNPVVISYPLDLTGLSPDNLVVGETHGPCFPGNRVFVMSYGPFYSKSLIVRNKATGVALTEGIDYKAVQTFIEPTLMTGKLVVSLVVIEAPAFGIEVTCQYQVLGGDYSLSTSALENLIEDLNNDDRAVRWGEIIGKPEAYPPTPHLTDIYDVFGWQYIVAAIEAIRQALLMSRGGNNDDIYAYIDLKHAQAMAAVADVVGDLGDHINDFNNPHRVTKDQIGLGLVGNYPLATPEIARLGLSHNTLITPYLIKYALEYHTNDFNNPHHVTKDQVNLGNVDNFITATLEMALAGTDNQSFLTPYLVKAMIAAAMSSTPPVVINGPTASFSVSPLYWDIPSEGFTGGFATVNYTLYNTSSAGTNPINSYAWNLGGGQTRTGVGPHTGTIQFAKPSSAGATTTVDKTIILVVTDTASMTHTRTLNLVFTVRWTVEAPPSLEGFVRINGLVVQRQYGTNTLERYQSNLQANLGVTPNHSFDIDIDPFWISNPVINWPGTGAGEAAKADYTVNWLVKNDYTHSAATYINNVVTDDGVQFVIPVQSTYYKAARFDITLTSLVTGLSTVTTGFIDARTTPTYVAPTADFELGVIESTTGLSVTKPTLHNLRFIDRSVTNVPGDPITEVMWDINGVGRVETGTSNQVPGGWLHWIGSALGSNDGLPVGTTPLTITISAKTATSSWVTRSRTFQLITNPAPPPPPTANFTFGYLYNGTYVSPPGATGARLTLNASSSAPGNVSYPIVSYQWALAFENGVTANLSGKTPPPYDITVVDSAGQRGVSMVLTVTDSYGGTATRTYSRSYINSP